MTKLKEYIKESLDSPFICESKEECLQKYGKKIFGNELFKGEQTSKEKLDIKYIRDYLCDNFGAELNNEFYQTLSDLKRCFKNNKMIASPEKTLYRGLSFSEHEMFLSVCEKYGVDYVKDCVIYNENKINIEGTEILSMINSFNKDKKLKTFKYVKNINYYPRNIVDSWSINKKKSVEYSSSNGNHGILFVLKDKNRDNFIFSPSVLKKITQVNNDEGETMYFDKNKKPLKCDMLMYIVE